MNLGNAYNVGLVRGMDGSDFEQALEIAARSATDSDEFCKLWEEYEAGFAEGVRVAGILKVRGQGVSY